MIQKNQLDIFRAGVRGAGKIVYDKSTGMFAAEMEVRHRRYEADFAHGSLSDGSGWMGMR